MKIKLSSQKNKKTRNSGNISPTSAVFRHIQSRPFCDDEATETEMIEMTKILAQIKKVKR